MMGCPNESAPDFIWDEEQGKHIMERFKPERAPKTSEEIKLYKEINSKIDRLLVLMSKNDESK